MDLKIRVCADPPSRKVLAFIVAEAMSNHVIVGEPMDSALRRTSLLIRKKPPQVEW